MVNPVPKLEQKYLDNCKVVPNRYEVLNLMPKGGICAEVEVLHGMFFDICLRKRGILL